MPGAAPREGAARSLKQEGSCAKPPDVDGQAVVSAECLVPASFIAILAPSWYGKLGPRGLYPALAWVALLAACRRYWYWHPEAGEPVY